MKYLRQSTASAVIVGPFPAPTTGLAVTTLTSQSGRAIKNGTGGAFTPASWSHDGGGHYLVGVGTGDTDTVGRLRLTFDSGANYLPVWEDFSVLSAAVYDWFFGTAAPSTPAAAQTIDLTTALPPNPTAGTVGAALYYGDKAIGRRNTAQGGTSSTITLDASASSNDNAFRGHQVTLTGGTGAGQTATIVGYAGGTKVATIVRDGGSGGWATTPDNTTTFMIVPQPLANVGMWLGSPPNALQAGRVDAYAGASAASLVVNIAGNITGNLSGSVGGVTGNVGGNVAGSVASVIAAVTLPANPPAGWIDTAAFASGATMPRVTLVDTTTDVTNGGTVTLGATAPAGWINAAAFASGTLVPSDVQKVKGGDPVPADLNNVGLKPTGLDQISMAPEPGVPATFRGLFVWMARRFYRSHKTPTSLVVESDAGAALTTQAVTDDGQGTESIGPPA